MIRRVHTPPTATRVPQHKSGQALLESFGIIMLLCLILFGMVQYVLMLTATEIIQYSADASARARSVGFNNFMVYKVNRVTSIPNAGLMTTPGGFPAGDDWTSTTVGEMWEDEIWDNPTSSQYNQIEQYNIPLFLGSENWGMMYGYLDYADWDTVSGPSYVVSSGETVAVVVRQEYPLRMPLFRAFSNSTEIDIRKEAILADHAELYLE